MLGTIYLQKQAASLTIITKQRQNTTNMAKHTGPFLANHKYGQVVKMTRTQYNKLCAIK
jgi:hypothetical protein